MEQLCLTVSHATHLTLVLGLGMVLYAMRILALVQQLRMPASTVVRLTFQYALVLLMVPGMEVFLNAIVVNVNCGDSGTHYSFFFLQHLRWI